MYSAQMNADGTPASLRRLRRRAQQYATAGQMTAAQKALESFLQYQPEDVDARMELSRAMLWRGQLRACVDQLLSVARLFPDDPGLIQELAERLFFIGEINEARRCLDRLEGMVSRARPDAVIAQARLRWMLGEIGTAQALMDKAMAAGSNQPGDYFMQALLSQYAGDIDRATETLESGLLRWPGFADFAVLLSSLRRQTPENNHVETLRKSLRKLPPRGVSSREDFFRAQFESSLFKELDDLGQRDEAWASLERCNELMRVLNPYDAEAEKAVTDAVIHASTQIAVGDADKGPKFEGPIPIFIIGLPRSGTTLLDRMLSNHTQVASAGELNDFQRQLSFASDTPANGLSGMLRLLQRSHQADFEELGARYLEHTQWRAPGYRYFIDKLPSNARMVHFIRRALPQARILHMVRDPMDVCYSNLKMMFGCSPSYSYSYGAQSLSHYHGQYTRLMNHWRASIPDAVLDVSYASLVSEPAAMLGRVLDHCGLEMQANCLHPEQNVAPVPTPNSNKLRERIHTRGLGEWKRYAEQLEPLQRLLS